MRKIERERGNSEIKRQRVKRKRKGSEREREFKSM